MEPSDRIIHLRHEQEKQKQRTILYVQEQLAKKKEECKVLIQRIKFEESEQKRKVYTFRLERTEQLITKLSSRLKNLGVTEKRGRPKKAVHERYQEQRKKFTAHLKPETWTYMQSLKDAGSISNISAFIDDIVAAHQKKNR